MSYNNLNKHVFLKPAWQRKRRIDRVPNIKILDGMWRHLWCEDFLKTTIPSEL